MLTAGSNTQHYRQKKNKHWIVFLKTFPWPLRLRKLKERKKPPAALLVGVLGSSSPCNWENSAPGRSMRRVMLLSTSSEKASGLSWRSFSTKKSGLKMMGSLPSPPVPVSVSWLITTLHTVPLWIHIGKLRYIHNLRLNFFSIWFPQDTGTLSNRAGIYMHF